MTLSAALRKQQLVFLLYRDRADLQPLNFEKHTFFSSLE
jgi:hypothetical protein